MPPKLISVTTARRIAINGMTLTGSSEPKTQTQAGESANTIGSAELLRTIRRLGLLQIDSVSVFARAHYMPLFSRLGEYDPAILDNLWNAKRSQRKVFEVFSHQAALHPIEDWPLWEWYRTERSEPGTYWTDWASAHQAEMDWIYHHIETNGAVAVKDIEHESNKRKGTWWGWSDIKYGLEAGVRFGTLSVAGRRGIERIYDLTERVIPAGILSQPAPSIDEAHLELIRRAARNLGVFTLADIKDTYYFSAPRMRELLAQLTELGEIEPVQVKGWSAPSWMWTGAKAPRRPSRDALLSPFDPLVRFRERNERLFNFDYRIEIYTPKPKRVYGYYCLPFLHDNTIAARVDLKVDRPAAQLLVKATWAEPGAPTTTAAALAAQLRVAAAWQGCDVERIVVENRGDLAGAVASELGVPLVAAAD